jgi:hypothetical protein
MGPRCWGVGFGHGDPDEARGPSTAKNEAEAGCKPTRPPSPPATESWGALFSPPPQRTQTHPSRPRKARDTSAVPSSPRGRRERHKTAVRPKATSPKVGLTHKDAHKRPKARCPKAKVPGGKEGADPNMAKETSLGRTPRRLSDWQGFPNPQGYYPRVFTGTGKGSVR